MPRKQNGWGTSKSLAFKGAGRVDRGKNIGSFGLYPRDRSFGSSVHRTLTEKWDLDSNWVKWRKGYEIYSRQAFAPLKVANPDVESDIPYVVASLSSILYQGTPYEIATTFTGFEFPTAKTDSNNHYVAKRTPEEKPLGQIVEVFNNPLVDYENKLNHEIHVKGIPDPINARLLLRMVGERLTDGTPSENRTEATLQNVLTEDNLPAIYKGKTAPKAVKESSQYSDLLTPTEVKIEISLDDISYPDNPRTYRRNQGLFSSKEVRSPEQFDVLANPNELVGKLVYLKNFYKEKPISELDDINWFETSEYMAAAVTDSDADQMIYVMDSDVSQLPPSMYDVADLPKLCEASGVYRITGTYVFNKKDYQKYFGRQYLSSVTVEGLVQDAVYQVLPFIIKSAGVLNGKLIITSEPFVSELLLFPELTAGATLVFYDKSFCKFSVDDLKGQKLNTDVDPWMDETFTSGKTLRPAEIYTCSCPNHSHALLSMPQASEPINDRTNNRQLRYPLPSVMGQSIFEGVGLTQAAGQISSWETKEHKLGFKMCKHSIAAMFNDGIKLQEPSQYPTVDARIKFEEKLAEQIDNTRDNFIASYERGGISLKEIVFALAQGLNLDSIETAYVVLRSS